MLLHVSLNVRISISPITKVKDLYVDHHIGVTPNNPNQQTCIGLGHEMEMRSHYLGSTNPILKK